MKLDPTVYNENERMAIQDADKEQVTVPTRIEELPSLKYREEANLSQHMTQLHLGQRKLLMSEIQFLTYCVKHQVMENAEVNIIYVGAAPGFHITWLIQLFAPNFKDCQFTIYLYDPSPIKTQCRESNVKLYKRQKLFDNDEATKYKNMKNLLFISDIRSGNNDQKDKFENGVDKDNKLQRRWIRILNPVYSLLKFRIPYNQQKYDHVTGKIWLQAWAPKTSTESRLLVKGVPPKKTYLLSEYEDRFRYHNVVNRTWVKYRSLDQEELSCVGMDRCYDCVREQSIWLDYLSVTKTEKSVVETVRRLVGQTNIRLRRGLHT